MNKDFAAEHTHRSNDAQAVIQEVHDRLDLAGVPRVEGRMCNDTTCNSKLGHRVKLLIAEREQWKVNNQENKLIAESNSRRADRAEATLHAGFTCGYCTNCREWKNQPIGCQCHDCSTSLIQFDGSSPVDQRVDELFRFPSPQRSESSDD